MKSIFSTIIMVRSLTVAALLLIAAAAHGAGLSFTGSRVIEVNPDASTGLEKIYVLEKMTGATATYQSPTARWSKWSNSGAAYAEPVATAIDGGNTSLALTGEADFGITVEDGGRMYHFWVVDYSAHRVEFTDVTVSDFNNDCTTMYLDVAPLQSGGRYDIPYYTINGAPRVLDRGYTLSYNTLEYDENNKVYNQAVKDTDLESLKQLIRVDKPLCDTRFTLSGDRFAREWGFATTVESDNYTTDAVEAMTYAEKEERDNDNEQNDQTTGLGGSAPVTITFVAAVTDAAKFTEWQLSSSPEFSNYELRFNQTEVEYTFTEYGTWYMRFQASNADGSCDYFSPVYEIQIGESRLVCPNAFSPGASEGVNDEWKVSYKSIVDFECHIFNRWGVKVATLTHPSQGWDGKYNGKLVPAGVYYYVIKARGADGHKYDLSGDINIIRYNQKGNQSVTE